MINVLNILKAAFFTPLLEEGPGNTPWGLTMLLWGPPGVGKSYRVKADLCRKWNLKCKVLSPGTDGEGAFGVTPVPDQSMSKMCYPPPYWASELQHGGVVFLDEVNQAPPTLQPAIMGIALDRRIGDCVLGLKVRRIAAANPTDMAAGGWDLAPPVANRFGHLDWESPTVDGWTDWLLGSNVADETSHDSGAEEKRVLAAWPEPYAIACGVVSGFVKARPQLLFMMPKVGSKDVNRSWPSPRTWEMATRAYASSRVHNLSEVEREAFIGSFVGSGPASELMTYINQMDLPNPSDILEGKVKFKHNPDRLDRTAAVLASCAALLAPPQAENRRPRAAKFWEILSQKEIMEDSMDVGFTAAKRMTLAKLHSMREAYTYLAKILPVLEEAGIQFDPSKLKKAGSGYEE